MIKIFNSSDDPRYNTAGRAGINVTHLLDKEQMFEIAKLAKETYGDELFVHLGLRPSVPYHAEEAAHQVAKAQKHYPQIVARMFGHPTNGMPEEFINQAAGRSPGTAVHFTSGSALQEAERLARTTGRPVRTYQLLTTTSVERVPSYTEQVVRKP